MRTIERNESGEWVLIYRVRRIRQNGNRGMSGWSDTTTMVATEDEARMAMDERMTGGVYEVQIDRADNTADWCNSGKWTRIASRRHKSLCSRAK